MCLADRIQSEWDRNPWYKYYINKSVCVCVCVCLVREVRQNICCEFLLLFAKQNWVSYWQMKLFPKIIIS